MGEITGEGGACVCWINHQALLPRTHQLWADNKHKSLKIQLDMLPSAAEEMSDLAVEILTRCDINWVIKLNRVWSWPCTHTHNFHSVAMETGACLWDSILRGGRTTLPLYLAENRDFVCGERDVQHKKVIKTKGKNKELIGNETVTLWPVSRDCVWSNLRLPVFTCL